MNRQAGEFDATFAYRPAIAQEAGVTRRDPSPVIQADGQYHVWYSKATVDGSGYYGSIFHAASPDGLTWAEQGPAITPAEAPAWDSNGVFTPTTLLAEGRYWLYYTAVPKPFDNDNGGPRGTPTAIGVASAASPDGPWRRHEGNPLLRPGPEGAWDSHRVDDACMIVRDGAYWMYYKGRQLALTPRETKMGLAVAEAPTGPFVKHPGSPVVASGHEVCVWPHGPGVAAMFMPVGPEGSTIQYSDDGIHFTVRATVEPPSAPGPYRQGHYRDGPGPGITWGLCQDHSGSRPFLVRFDCDLRARR